MLTLTVNLAETNDLPGTIRWAIAQSYKNPVTIKFSPDIDSIDFSDIYVEDKDSLELRTLYITEKCKGLDIIGPITLKGVSLHLSGIKSSVNVENLRMRVGDRNYGESVNVDCLYAENCDDINFKKCSFAYSIDESVSIERCENVEFDRCIFGPPLHVPKTADGKFIHKEGEKGSHGYGIRSCSNLRITRSLLADFSKRNPQVNNGNAKDEIFDILVKNCVIYNYGEGFVFNYKDTGKTARINVDFQHNVFIPGARTSPDSLEFNIESGDVQFVLDRYKTNRIAHREQFRLLVENSEGKEIVKIDNGRGNTVDMIGMMKKEQVGCMPADNVDLQVLQRAVYAFYYPEKYDNLDPENFYKNWPESGWINNL